ncbi:hypothetical protein Tco_0296097 [Tanacetum coccineum]
MKAGGRRKRDGFLKEMTLQGQLGDRMTVICDGIIAGNQSSDKEMGALLPIASESRIKLAAVNENEKQHLQWFFDACKGIPQWPLITHTLHTCSGHISHTTASSPRMVQKKQQVQGFGPPSETKRVAIATPAVAEAEPKEEAAPKRPPVRPKREAEVNISGPSGELDGTLALLDGRDTTKTDHDEEEVVEDWLVKLSMSLVGDGKKSVLDFLSKCYVVETKI